MNKIKTLLLACVLALTVTPAFAQQPVDVVGNSYTTLQSILTALTNGIPITNGSTTDTDDGTVAGNQVNVAMTIAVPYGYDGSNDVRIRAKGTTPGSSEVGLVTRPFSATDGTNTMPTMDAVARAGFQKITDGTSTLVVDPCQGNAKVYTPISQATSTQLITGTSSKKIYICSISLVGSDAENISLVAGTGSVCATSTVAVMGGATAANGFNLAANGGFVQGGGGYSIAATTVNADNLCLFQSGSGRVSGVMTSVVQ